MTDDRTALLSRQVHVHGIDLAVTTAGRGPALLLLHGFPHTAQLWSRMIPDLARDHLVIAPDLRGLGGSSRAADGYDVESLAADAIALLDALGVRVADVMAIDAGAPIAFLLALRHPDRVRRLVLMEAILGDLPRPGAPAAAPWWFGFHSVPGLAERAVEGIEDAYIGFFLDTGMETDGMGAELRAELIDAYRGRESLRCAFEHYRAMPGNAAQLRDALTTTRLTVPTLAVGSRPIGAGLHAQLVPVADDLAGALVEDAGHIIPLDRPRELLAVVRPFLA